MTDLAKAKSAVVLLSAGLDSSLNLYKAVRELNVKLVLTFDYGQKAARQEIARASRLAKKFAVEHQIIQLEWFARFTRTALVGNMQIPQGLEIEIDNLARSLETAKSVWVPNRNGIFLNIAAGFAEGLGAELIIPGFNYEEAQTFSDNSGAFLKAMNHSLEFSTSNRVSTHCFSSTMTKSQIVAEGQRLGMDFAELWPCYKSENEWCGECESCKRFARALSANGLNFVKFQKASAKDEGQ